MDALLQDLRYALRGLRARPGYAAAVVATWALGLGAAVTVFAVAWGVLWKPLPYERPDRLVVLWQTDPQNDSDRERASAPDFRDFRDQSRSFAGLAGVTTQPLNLRGIAGETERVSSAGISHGLPRLLGRAPALGRAFTATEDRSGGAPVAILSHDLWRTRFGGDPSILERAVLLDEVPHTVVGVMPEGFDFPGETQVWRPFEQTLGEFGDLRGVHNVLVVGRLAPGTTGAAASAEVVAIAARLEAAYAEDNVGRGARLESLRQAVSGEARGGLLVLLGSVGLLLVIASANAASLIVSRGLSSLRDLGVRSALGADRTRLVRQLLCESLVLVGLSALAALGLAVGALRLLRASRLVDLPRAEELGIDAAVALFSLGLAAAVGTLSGLVPALRLSRGSLGTVLQRGGRSGGDPRARATRGALVVSQVALAVVLTVGAGLLGRSLASLLSVDPGFEPRGVLLAEIKLPESRYPAPRETYPRLTEVLAFYDRALERLAVLPGVERVALAMNHPMQRGWTTRIEVQGYQPPPGPPEEVRVRGVSAGYFETAGIELLRGRSLARGDTLDAEPVLVVNEAFVDKYFPDRDPLGRTAGFWGTPRRIVGVVGNVRFSGLGAPLEPAVYPSLHQLPMGQFQVLVKTGRDAASVAPEVRSAIAEIDRDLGLFGVRTLEEAVAETLGRPRFQLSLMAAYALLALALAAIGVYGLVAQLVLDRTREIGVRMALGADRAGVLRLVLGNGAVMAGLGVAAGLLGAAALSRLAASLLHGVGPVDPPTYAAVASVLLVVALAAAWLPARRAARIDPVRALRE